MDMRMFICWSVSLAIELNAPLIEHDLRAARIGTVRAITTVEWLGSR